MSTASGATKNANRNLCFTKYDKDKLKIIDIGANLSGKKISPAF
jgi:hypothetical protein